MGRKESNQTNKQTNTTHDHVMVKVEINLLTYQDKCFLLNGWMLTCFTLCMLGTFLVHAFLLSVFLTIFLKKILH